MNHSHVLYDSDPHFTIDPISRKITNTSYTKTTIIQHDHNSERFTFELPKVIEGHDMEQCNLVQIHYLNVEANTKDVNTGVYVVDDLGVKEDDDQTLVFSWLISNNATQMVGQLQFLIRFACVNETNGKIEYAWNTGIYAGISVSAGINNGGAIAEDYPDVLQQWKNELNDSMLVKMEQTRTSTISGGINEITATFGDGHTSVYQIRNGDTGLVGSIETIDKKPLHFFVGTNAQYDSLSEQVKQDGLYAIITDDTEFNYLTNVGGYGERMSLVVGVAYFTLADGVEILAKTTYSSPTLNPDSDANFSLEVNDTGRYPIYSGMADEGQYGFKLWGSEGETLRLRFDEANGRWCLCENITQNRVYEPDWVPFNPDTMRFEVGKTYQVKFNIVSGNCNVQHQFTVLQLSVGGYQRFPRIYDSDDMYPFVQSYLYRENDGMRLGGFVQLDEASHSPLNGGCSGFYYRIVK